MSAGRQRTAAVEQFTAIVEQVTGAHMLLMLDDPPQAVVVLDVPGQAELVLACLDREGDRAAVTLSRAGVQQVADTLAAWLEQQL